jgi:hypothetical protein
MRRADTRTIRGDIGARLIVQTSGNSVSTWGITITTLGTVAEHELHFKMGDILASSDGPSEQVVEGGASLPVGVSP